MGHSGYAAIRFDAEQKRSAIGVGQAGEKTDGFPRELFLFFLLRSTPPILIGAQELQKLSALLLEKKSDFFGMHLRPVRVE
jgi:hypothetical protein